jgi:hypothetical protein
MTYAFWFYYVACYFLLFCYFLYLFKCVSGFSIVVVSGDVFFTLSFYLRTLRTMSHFGWGKMVVVDTKKTNLFFFFVIKII